MSVQENPGGRHENPALMWAGHFSTPLMMGIVPLIVIYHLAGQPGSKGILGWAVSALLLGWLSTMMLDAHYHEARLCERCIAATPLDPQAAVSRWKPALRLHHSKRLSIVTFLFIIGWFFAGPWLFPDHTWPARVLSALAFMLFGIFYLSSWRHRRLYPWCPWCNWGGGGDEEQAPDPDPDDHGVKTLA